MLFKFITKYLLIKIWLSPVERVSEWVSPLTTTNPTERTRFECLARLDQNR